MTASPSIEAQLTAQVHTGPLSGLSGAILATTPHGKTYLRLKDLPGVTVVIPSHLLQLPATPPN